MNHIEKTAEAKYSEDQIRACVALLEDLVQNSVELAHLSPELRVALIAAAGRLSRPERDEIRKRKRDSRRIKRQRVVNYERRLRASTGIRSAREAAVFTAPLPITGAGADGRFKELELVFPRDCYVCKRAFTRVHFFYDAMCPACAEFNYAKRFQAAPLDGRTALITGSRLKIGYQATLMMLRAGARVVATTRFPVDSALRYSREEDFPRWQDRLHVYGLDLRHTPSVEIFCNYIEQKYDRLDILVNNAAQTVRRPPGFYGHLMENETKKMEELPEGVQRLLRPFDMCRRGLMSYTHVNPATDLVPAAAWNGKMQGIGLSA
ncbi:MAG: SDR family NAD(P)-dependent oxidoreductase, partial [Candidatus Omnitrophica bacterium]|nr:SDR family NAD(P)-dependent oxidoreductase [Candidatus Omnitrophota bacterium]